MTDPFAEGGPLEAAHFVFQEWGLPMPPVPAPFLPDLHQHGPAIFTSRARTATLDDGGDRLAEALTGAPPFFGVSHEGYGTNNWRLRYQAVLPDVAVFIELPFGNAYGDAAASRFAILRAFDGAARVLAADWPDRVVVDHTANRSRYWRDGAWHEVADAFAALAPVGA